MKLTSARPMAARLSREISLESPTSRNLRCPAICFRAVIAPTTWADLAGTTVVGVVEDRDPAVAAGRKPRLDLFEVRTAVFGMAPARRGEPLLRVVVGAVQRDRGR